MAPSPKERFSRDDKVTPPLRLPPIAAIQANHLVGTHRLPHRDSRGKRFFHRTLLSKLTEASVPGRDEVRKLICPDPMLLVPGERDKSEWWRAFEAQA